MHMVVAHIEVWTGGCVHGMCLICIHVWSIHIMYSNGREHALHKHAHRHHMWC